MVQPFILHPLSGAPQPRIAPHAALHVLSPPYCLFKQRIAGQPEATGSQNEGSAAPVSIFDK
eukprot:scaffold86914_cov21-Tisochrysis_lutea.AAC.1